MAPHRRFDEELRSIGQALNVRGVTSFELNHAQVGYFIKDLGEHRPSLRSGLRRWLQGQSGDQTYGFDLAEVEALSKAGRAQRSSSGQLTHFRDLPNVLRTLGAYVDSKEGVLIELCKLPISVKLRYRDKSGYEQTEERPVSSFYDFFLELCKKRSGVPSDRY
jgi:hypothetical protein